MEGLFTLAIIIFICVRMGKAAKKKAAAAKEREAKEQARAFAFEEPVQKTEPIHEPNRPVQQRIDLDRPPMAPRIETVHRHVERVHTETKGFGGEGDAARYQTRTVSCETVGHDTSVPAASLLPELNRGNLIGAVIMSEVLGKPKALGR